MGRWFSSSTWRYKSGFTTLTKKPGRLDFSLREHEGEVKT
jgi:hypothetical protein